MTSDDDDEARRASPVALTLDLLCAGAVKGLVLASEEAFAAEPGHEGVRVRGRFGPVGAMRDALRAGAPCDVLVVTDAMVRSPQASGELRADSRRVVGRVPTSIAVPSGATRPGVANADTLRAALAAASAIHDPDVERSTAGAHFVAVVERLGSAAELKSRLRMHESGAAAMAALAAAGDLDAIGCTQATEIIYTQGVDLVGDLPPGFDLATDDSAGIARAAADEALARAYIEFIAGPRCAALRAAGGFAP